METRKVRHVGRHSERHTGSVIRARDVLFVPVAAETTGAINKDRMDSLSDLARRITQSTDDYREIAFLFQRLSTLFQRYNAVAVLFTLAHTTPEDAMVD